MFYYFDNINIGKYHTYQLAKVLNNFIGFSGKYSNPLFFDINSYMKKSGKNIFGFLYHYMKFYEHFFSYHLSEQKIYHVFQVALLFL